MLRSRIFSIALVATLTSSCSHPGAPRDVSAERKPVELRLFVSLHRHGGLESCGCTLAPFGGVRREWNAQAFVREQGGAPLVPMTIGTTFLPAKNDFQAKHLEHYGKKADYMADALKALGTRAVGVSIDDLRLGVDVLRRLEKRVGAPFVSANLVDAKGSPLFRRSITLEGTGDARVIVTSLSHGVRAPYGQPADGIAAMDGVASLRKVLAEEKRPDLLVVLSSLPQGARAAALSGLDVPTLWMGGLDEADQPDVIQSSPGLVYVSPLELGRSVVLVDIKPTPGMKALASPDVAKQQAERKKLIAGEIADVRKRLAAKKLTKFKRSALKETLVSLEASLKAASSLVDKSPSDGAAYAVRPLVLDERFEDPGNPMAALVKRYKEEVREVMSLPAEDEQR